VFPAHLRIFSLQITSPSTAYPDLFDLCIGFSVYCDSVMPYKKNLTLQSLSVSVQLVERRIYLIRGQKVMIDFNLAELYGVPAKRLNERVSRNMKRFPKDFMFRLTQDKANVLRSQFVISNISQSNLRSQIATSSLRSPAIAKSVSSNANLRSQIATSSLRSRSATSQSGYRLCVFAS
jgi:hypothetical protein